MELNHLSKTAHEAAANKGFWEKELSAEHCLCLVISEIGEAVEADRKEHHHDIAAYKAAKNGKSMFSKFTKKDPEIQAFKKFMKDTVEDELADVVIRLCDLAGDLQIDFDKMSTVNYFRAFGRWDFCENAFALMKGLSRENVNINRRILFGITYVQKWAEHIGFDLDYAIAEKMKYNATREIRNGKSY